MLKKAAAYLRGSLRVRVLCAFPERVLNICSARGIAFSAPAFLGGNELAFTIDRRDWRRVREACAAIEAQAHIERAAGVPFALGRLRARRALLAGLALCAALLAVNACFVWDLRVEGCEKVSGERVLRVLAKNGLRRGTPVFSLRRRSLCNQVLLEMPELAWLTVNIRGCRATVIVRETIPKPEIVNESRPTNVVARRDGLITEVRALDGEAKVLPGTTVRRGQLLISGIVNTSGVESPVVGTRYLAGKGEVRARTWYELSTRIPLWREIKSPTGEPIKCHAVLWGEKRVKIIGKGSGNFRGNYDKITVREQWVLPGGLALPLTWVTETLTPWEPVRVARSRGEALEQGRAVLEESLERRLGDGEIVSSRVSSAVQGDWLLVTLSAECAEEIGVTVPIPVN